MNYTCAAVYKSYKYILVPRLTLLTFFLIVQFQTFTIASCNQWQKTGMGKMWSEYCTYFLIIDSLVHVCKYCLQNVPCLQLWHAFESTLDFHLMVILLSKYHSLPCAFHKYHEIWLLKKIKHVLSATLFSYLLSVLLLRKAVNYIHTA